MKFRDRSEILAQLQDAFVQEEKKESRVTTEVLRIDNHNVARVTQIRDPSLEEKLYAKYPEAVTIREMITILGSSDDSDIKQAGLRLQKKTLDSFDDA
ncbi:MAG: hypothetical protein J6Y89_04780, partial [Lachnospiraceae bacterium]|nr:hypothetical protein [Lachnospiraceae bacterium]